MTRVLHFVLLFVALLAVQVFSAVVREEDVARKAKPPKPHTSTVISTVTATATGPTTVTYS